MSATQQQDCHKTSPIPPSYPVQPSQSTYPSNSMSGAVVTSSTPSDVMVVSHSGQRQGMCGLQLRHPMFKLGVALLLLSTMIFIVGYSVPAWVNSSGLWITGTCKGWKCVNSLTAANWFSIVRITESFALVLLLLSVAVEVYQDVCTSPPLTENKAVEVFAFLAAMFGFTGLIIFAVKVEENPEILDGLEVQEVFSGYYNSDIGVHLSWGFMCTVGACGLVMLAAILITCSRLSHGVLADSAMASTGVPLLSSQSFEPAATALPMMTIMAIPYHQGQAVAPPPPPYSQYHHYAAQGTPVVQSSLPPGVSPGAPSFYICHTLPTGARNMDLTVHSLSSAPAAQALLRLE